MRLITLLIGIVLAGSFATHTLYTPPGVEPENTAQIVDSVEEDVEDDQAEEVAAGGETEVSTKEEDGSQEKEDVESILQGFDRIEQEYSSIDDLYPFEEENQESSEEGN